MSYSVGRYPNLSPLLAERVVVTGLGVVSSIGTGREVFWKRLMSGCSGIGVVTSFDTSDFPVHQGAEVTEFVPADSVLKLSSAKIGRASQFAIAAARLAIADASLSLSEDESHEIGVAIGTTSGEPRVIECFDDRVVDSDLEKVDGRFIATYPC